MSRMMLTLCLVLTVCQHLTAAGYVDRANFVVVVPPGSTATNSQRFAERLHERAEFYRRKIALDWLGDELPKSVGRTVIHVDFSSTDDLGLTWIRGNPRRTFHNVYLKISSDRALSTTLPHELVHVVLATEYAHPNRMAHWVEEGIASQYDDRGRQQLREKMLKWYAQSGNWPSLKDVFNRKTISTNDKASYAVAASVAEFLIRRRGKKRLVRFGRDANQLGWDPALRENYEIYNVQQLESLWQAMVLHQYRKSPDQVAAVR